MRNRLNRLFLVLFITWGAYCLFISPLQMNGRARTHYQADRSACYEMLAKYDLPLESCLSDFEKEFRTGLYSGFPFFWNDGESFSYRGYYRHMGWLLATMIVVPALLAYLLTWGLNAVWLWVWRGKQQRVV